MSVPITPERFTAGLRSAGVGLVTSVPCSYFGSVLRHLDDSGEPGPRHLAAANEGSALASAAGSWLAGVPAAVLMQNSGFGNMVNPLTSLLLPYRIPVLVFVSMRGWPQASPGEPQHVWMGRVVPGWLESLELPYWLLTQSGKPPYEQVLAAAGQALRRRRPAFVLVGKGAIAPVAVSAGGRAGEVAGGAVAGGAVARRPTRADVVGALAAERSGEFVIATTGYLSRELYDVDDRPANFYMQGSMGHAGAIALGVALSRPERRVVVLDGDGALLMHLGAAAAIGHFAPANLLHVVFDNASYESTGGQPVAARAVNYPAVASGLGYRRVLSADTAAALRPAVRELLDERGPAMLLVRGVPSHEPRGRASEAIGVDEIAARFAAALAARCPDLAAR
ncbi:MAG TPA: phosphonopyruvate decarboxylase [Streptosporangiaceae bacterium]|nr:phosphonopyruvate decarboxylase [Streptosporangiaceae bacterium]